MKTKKLIAAALAAATFLALSSNAGTQAIESLEAVAVNDPAYVDALAELQKIHYAHGEWQKFFANAIFYRQRLLDNETAIKRNLRARPVSLEILALARHCLWSEATALAVLARAAAAMHRPAETAEIDKTISYLRLQHAFPEAAMTNGQSRTGSSIFSNTILWRPGSGLRHIQHPKVLRVVVESRCAKS